MRWRRRSMSAARMMTTMTRPMRNMALASLDDPLGAGRRATADPWCLLPTLHRQPLTGNLILELPFSFSGPTGDRPPGGSHRDQRCPASSDRYELREARARVSGLI